MSEEREKGNGAKHTPGPWKAELTGMSPVKIVAGDDIVGYAVYGPRRNVDVEHGGGVPVAEANAHLIKAAPDLLAAVKEANAFLGKLADGLAQRHISLFDIDEIQPFMGIGDRLVNAWIKAEGRSQ